MFVRKVGLVWSLRSLRSDRGGRILNIDNWQWSTSVCISAVTGNRREILLFPPLPTAHDLNKWPTSSFCQDRCFILFIFIDSLVSFFIFWIVASVSFLLAFVFSVSTLFLFTFLLRQIITWSSCTAHALEDFSCAVSGVRCLC